MVVLAKRFTSPKDAIVAMTEQENVSSGRTTYSPIEVEHVCLDGHGTPASSLSSIPIAKEDTIMDSFLLLSSNEKMALASSMVSHIALNEFGLTVASDFLEMSLKGMCKLMSEGKSNVIYGLCKAFGSNQLDKPNECLFPISRMPMGLLEYMVNFFISEHGNKVSLNCV